jgi:hypothetical protein
MLFETLNLFGQCTPNGGSSVSSHDSSRRFRLLFLLSVAVTGPLLQAQTPTAAAAYDPRLTFAPLTLPDPVNAYRSSNGAPGPGYWQNEADYELHAELDTATKQLRASETITYTNNSPDTLPSLWIQLDQNIYRKDSRSQAISGGLTRRRVKQNVPEPSGDEVTNTEGFVFDSVEIGSDRQTTKVDYIVNDTRMQIRLAQPLPGRGGKLKIHIQYHYQIPGVWGGRTSWGNSKQG